MAGDHFSESRTLGKAGTGMQHWWQQRLTALALLPLSVWMGFSADAVVTSEYQHLVYWFSTPWHPILLSAFILAGLFHAQLGLQVVIEDYVHQKITKLSLLICVKIACFLAAIVAMWAMIKLVAAP